mmetsp:Transcript_11892/g.37957  ORF Transcript_11892/g.37957 Transcript_11892/m.37957 type:complete len:89 (-) Transcript_11892:118-384(-)
MALVEGGALAQARLALRHSEAVLSGLGLGTRRPLSLIAYVVRESDVVQVRAACHAWLRRRCGGRRLLRRLRNHRAGRRGHRKGQGGPA